VAQVVGSIARPECKQAAYNLHLAGVGAVANTSHSLMHILESTFPQAQAINNPLGLALALPFTFQYSEL
jgi:hypothetical protein